MNQKGARHMNQAFWKRHRPPYYQEAHLANEDRRSPSDTILSPPTPKHPPQNPQPIPGNREHQIHRWIHLDLPIPAVGLEAEEADVVWIDGVLVVNPDEAEGFERWEEFTQGPDVDKRRPAAQPDFGLAAIRHKAIDVVGIDHPLLTA
jgi:hypothetical protein